MLTETDMGVLNTVRSGNYTLEAIMDEECDATVVLKHFFEVVLKGLFCQKRWTCLS